MTCIVGINNRESGYIYIGADSRGASGYSISERKDKKVFISHNIAYGFTSSFRMGQILQYHTCRIETTGDLRNKDPFGYVVQALIPHYREILKYHGYTHIKDHRESIGNFLIGFDYSLFEIDSDFQVAEVKEDYAALGCGSDLALGSLDTTQGLWSNNPRLRIRRAINTAAKFNSGVGGKINIVKI